MIERFFIILATYFPQWLVSVFAVAAALSFAARHREQYLRGRIREYPLSAVGVAVVWLAAAAFYLFLFTNTTNLDAARGMSRLLWTLLATACIAFNWGSVTDTLRDGWGGAAGRLRSLRNRVT